MSIASILNRIHSQAKANRWLWLFSLFCRYTLAFGFFAAGMVKIMGERFASGLHSNHPMGHYLEALSITGYYYAFIGYAQIIASIFLLFSRTSTLGAFIYFPIIFNICILTFATRFDGSMFTAPLMTLANLYVLAWNYEKWKYILPFNGFEDDKTTQEFIEKDINDQEFKSQKFRLNSLYARFRLFLKQLFNDKFPFLFFAGVFATVVFFILIFPRFYSVKPHNTLSLCLRQFKDTNRTQAGNAFCNCIHTNGETLDKCLNDFDNIPNDSDQTP